MIPQIVLDDRSFSDIVENAKKKISVLIPEWTDYNTHDPGITLIELLAWLVEMQQFHLDQMGEGQIRKNLKLLGIEPDPVRPAEGELSLGGLHKHICLPKGSRFYAGDVCFEMKDTRYLDAAEAKKLFCEEQKADGSRIKNETPANGKRLMFPAFGDAPMKGNVLGIGFDGFLTPGVKQKLCLHFFCDAPVRRNPMEQEGQFVPLAEYSVWYRTKSGERRAELLEDTTHQMIEDGFVTFVIKEQMEAGEEGLYWLYFKLERSEYDLPPVIDDISLLCVEVRQTKTLAEKYEGVLKRGESIHVCCALAESGTAELYVREKSGYRKYEGSIRKTREKYGWDFWFPEYLNEQPTQCCMVLYESEYRDRMFVGAGKGLPSQEYPVRIENLCRTGLSVLAETADGSGFYEFWEECSDFDAFGPTDRRFHFSEEDGILFFGDCDRGAAPEGRIILVSAHTSLGAAGNVKAGSICRSECKNLAVSNDRQATGGADSESLDRCRERLFMRQDERYRAVTCADFDRLVKQTPGLMIENVKTFSASEFAGENRMEEHVVSVVVKPYSKMPNPMPGEAYRKNILHMLESRRMIGTEVRIIPPEYIAVDIFVEIVADIHNDEAEEHIKHVMTAYFDGIRAEFGACIAHSAIYGRIDILSFVTEIRSLGIDAQGKNVRRSRSGDIILPANGLAYLRECTVC